MDQEPTPELPSVPRGPKIKVDRDFDIRDRRSEVFFAAVETTRMPMIVTDPHKPDNPIVFANNAFVAMTGYALDELVGNNCRLLQGPETDQGTLAEIREAVREEREISTEILNYRKDGGSFWNALYISPVRDQDGRLLYFFGSQLDVSRRRDAEDALRQAQKMEALGQLTGGIAHDFNNLLQVMLGYHELVMEGLDRPAPDAARMKRAVRNAHMAAERAATLTRQLLAFARKQRLDGRTLNLNGAVQGMADLIHRTLGEEIETAFDLDPALANCRIDPSQCEVALLNVLINARDALEGREVRRVTIRTRNVELRGEPGNPWPGLPEGRYAAVSVADTGCGMPPEIRKRVMEPFFTTKEEGRGTGLGLSMVYGFVKQSGGTVRIDSEEGEGTTVHLLFPATEEAGRAAGPAAGWAPGGAAGRAPGRAMDRGGSETILVVDDRADVGDLAQAFLEEFGYTILRAANGAEALARLDGPARIDMLFSDLIMPGGMNGVVLAREARRRRPRLKVLLTTGYAEASLERFDAGGAEFEMIDKPYKRLELVRKVRQVLDGPTGVS